MRGPKRHTCFIVLFEVIHDASWSGDSDGYFQHSFRGHKHKIYMEYLLEVSKLEYKNGLLRRPKWTQLLPGIRCVAT